MSTIFTARKQIKWSSSTDNKTVDVQFHLTCCVSCQQWKWKGKEVMERWNLWDLQHWKLPRCAQNASGQKCQNSPQLTASKYTAMAFNKVSTLWTHQILLENESWTLNFVGINIKVWFSPQTLRQFRMFFFFIVLPICLISPWCCLYVCLFVCLFVCSHLGAVTEPSHCGLHLRLLTENTTMSFPENWSH